MNNRYKFRYWDKKSEKMRHIYLGDFSHELMQFTGLLDCEGKDIYQGDLCRLLKNPSFSSCDRTEFLYEVVFEKGCFMIREVDHHSVTFYENPENIEVIGSYR